MKTTLLILALTTAFVFGHGEVEIGPNGGRILEFSKNESMHGEVTAKGGKFRIAVLDKNMKPVALGEQTITVTAGDRNDPRKVPVVKEDNHFVFPTAKPGEWVIVQFKENAKAKAITARIKYDTKVCGACKNEEWLCKCPASGAKK